MTNSEISPGRADLVLWRRFGRGFWFVIRTASLATDRRNQSLVRTLRAQSMSEKWFAGSTGDSPDETGATVRANGNGLFAPLLVAVPVGESPTGAGGSPAPPIFKTGFQGTST